MQQEEADSKELLTRGIAQEIGNLLTFLLGEVSLLKGETNDELREAHLADMDSRLMRASDLTHLLASQINGDRARETVNLNEILLSLEQSVRMGGRAVKALRLPSLPLVEGVSAEIRQLLRSVVAGMMDRIHGVPVYLRTGTEWLLDEKLAEDPLGAGLRAGEYAYCEIIVGNDPLDTPLMLAPGLDLSLMAGGLEMSAVIGIIRSHRGVVASGRAEGSNAIRVYFPSLETRTSYVGSEHPVAEGEEEWRGAGTALFVDDEESVRMLGERLLDAFGFEVVTAVDGRDGVQKFRQLADNVRLVVLDVTMPHLNGLEAFKEIRKLKPQVPVLFISGYANAVNEESLDNRAAFLAKPFRMGDMRNKIKRIAESVTE